MDETKKKKKNSNLSMKPMLSSLMLRKKPVMINSVQPNEMLDSEECEDLILVT